MFGLSTQHIHTIQECFSRYKGIDKVVLYGSRAMGLHREASDIELTIEGSLSLDQLFRLENDLDDLLLPYKIDLSLKKHITHPELLEHIERVGVVVYDNHALSPAG